eukprot:scaffold1893_cov220-Amphora_coffeaeformis.AAC.1
MRDVLKIQRGIAEQMITTDIFHTPTMRLTIEIEPATDILRQFFTSYPKYIVWMWISTTRCAGKRQKRVGTNDTMYCMKPCPGIRLAAQ